MESLLKKNELSYPNSSQYGLNEDTSKTVTSSNKSMDIGDHVVCLDDMKPTYGVIRDVYKTEGLPHAEVAFVSITFDILHSLLYTRTKNYLDRLRVVMQFLFKLCLTMKARHVNVTLENTQLLHPFFTDRIQYIILFSYSSLLFMRFPLLHSSFT